MNTNTRSLVSLALGCAGMFLATFYAMAAVDIPEEANTYLFACAVSWVLAAIVFPWKHA